jgi:hypothetical protein
MAVTAGPDGAGAGADAAAPRATGGDAAGAPAPAVTAPPAPDPAPSTGGTSPGGHADDHGDDPATAPDAHQHTSTPAEGGMHDHASVPAADDDAAHRHGTMRDYDALWAAATPEERAGATALVEATKAATAKYADYDVARAAGYRPNPQGGPNATHHPGIGLVRDGRVLDPDAPESLMYWTAPNGEKVLVGAVYKAGPREDAPAPGGDLTAWHTHVDDHTRCYPAQDPGCPQHGMKMLHVFFFDGVHDPFTENMLAAAGGRRAFARAMRDWAA